MSVTVIPTIADCSGTIWFTDIQLQEGANLTGYIPHTQVMLKKSEGKSPVWYNSIVRTKETVVIPNLGGTAAPLDIHICPKDDMSAGTVKLSQGAGGQRVSLPDAMAEDDDVALLAESRVCSKNGMAFPKEGFYQYSAAWDSKHNVEVEKGKSARLLISMQEMDDTNCRF